MNAFIKSFRYAFRGIQFAWQGRNLRVQVGAALAVVTAGLFFKISQADWIAVLIMIGLVLAFETMNSAIENLVNLVSPEIHPIAGKVKDLAAGAVLILSVISAVVGILVFLPYVLPLFS